MSRISIAFIANWDWVFFNFRLPLASAFESAGAEIFLICPRGEYFSEMEKLGFHMVEWKMERKSLGLLAELGAILNLRKILSRLAPDAVHNFTIKPILYGTIAARSLRIGPIINNFTGLGYLFSDGLKPKLLRLFVLPIMRMLLKSQEISTLFQNNQDQNNIVQRGIVAKERSAIIPGTGVDLSRFPSRTYRESGETIDILMASRLLTDKGVNEYFEAAQTIRASWPNVKFLLAGASDPGNPASVNNKQLEAWNSLNLVELLGHRSDMDRLLAHADIAVLPSYHEGVPLFLIEAAAAGLPIVASDIPGCRMVVTPGENGYLVPIKDSKSLASAIEKLLKNKSQRVQMGNQSREIAQAKFSIEKINERYVSFYRTLGIKLIPTL
jgi:glycosyltransferase involved in cell wall biosynthesis